jgi:hypothetical protein
MEYFGSTVLMAAVSSFLVVLVDLPKIIGPSLFSSMITSAVPILMISVSTLDQGYPLLQHEGAASVQHPKATLRVALNPTTW